VTEPTIDPATIEPLIVGRTYEDMTIGWRFRTAARTITEADLVAFVTLAGLTEPLFLDDRGSRDAGYPGRLVPGTLTFAYAEGLVMQTGVIHDTGLAFLHADVNVEGPVFVGDTILVVVEVLESRPARTGARGIVITRNTVHKRDGSAVLTYDATRLQRGRV
jgi:acyl dehydratase